MRLGGFPGLHSRAWMIWGAAPRETPRHALPHPPDRYPGTRKRACPWGAGTARAAPSPAWGARGTLLSLRGGPIFTYSAEPAPLCVSRATSMGVRTLWSCLYSSGGLGLFAHLGFPRRSPRFSLPPAQPKRRSNRGFWRLPGGVTIPALCHELRDLGKTAQSTLCLVLQWESKWYLPYRLVVGAVHGT